jgi:holo-[acyl-carrier protein] synthase
MSIYGIGTDIINVSRIEKILKKNKIQFKKKIFTKKEIFYCDSKKTPESYYAKRFAAKEAFVKALGTGFSNGLLHKDVEIINNKKGKPIIKMSSRSAKIINKILKNKKYSIHLSLSDDKPWAVATVIINKNDQR